MRLYLSSFRLGDHPEQLVALAGRGARVAVIANAMDDAPTVVRSGGVDREIVALADLGFTSEEVDLRAYFGYESRLEQALAGFDALWLRGGNVFLLRYALERSGADTVITDALVRDALVLGGYSAGPCVLAPSLRGLEAVDDATAVMRIYGSEPIWHGLGILDHAIVPHCPQIGSRGKRQMRERKAPQWRRGECDATRHTAREPLRGPVLRIHCGTWARP